MQIVFLRLKKMTYNWRLGDLSLNRQAPETKPFDLDNIDPRIRTGIIRASQVHKVLEIIEYDGDPEIVIELPENARPSFPPSQKDFKVKAPVKKDDKEKKDKEFKRLSPNRIVKDIVDAVKAGMDFANEDTSEDPIDERLPDEPLLQEEKGEVVLSEAEEIECRALLTNKITDIRDVVFTYDNSAKSKLKLLYLFQEERAGKNRKTLLNLLEQLFLKIRL